MTPIPAAMNEPRKLWVLGHHVTLIPAGGKIRFFEALTPRDVPGPPPHRHEDADEFFYVVEGSLSVMQGETWTSVGPGGYVNVPRGTVHTFRNDGDGDLRFLSGYEPSGFEQFFLEAGVDAAESDARETSVSEESVARALGAFERHGAVLAPEVTPA